MSPPAPTPSPSVEAAVAAARVEYDAELDKLGDADRANRSTRTAAQGGVGFAAITVLTYLASFADLDLDPNGDGVDLPGTVSSALTVLGAWLVAKWMNRKPPPTG